MNTDNDTNNVADRDDMLDKTERGLGIDRG